MQLLRFLSLCCGIMLADRAIISDTIDNHYLKGMSAYINQAVHAIRLRGGSSILKGSKPSDITICGVSHERAAALGDIARRALRQERKRRTQDVEFDLEPSRKQTCARSLDTDVGLQTWTTKAQMGSHNRTHSSTPTQSDLVLNSILANETICSSDEYRARHSLSVKMLSTSSEKTSTTKPNKPTFELLAPVQEIDRAPFSPEILHMIRSQGFCKPSPIQAQCWPYLMAKYDVVAVASTGSGKTCG